MKSNVYHQRFCRHGRNPLLPLPLREGVGGRGCADAVQGGGIIAMLDFLALPPSPPTRSRKGRGRTFFQPARSDES
jgi:hypothetical protein